MATITQTPPLAGAQNERIAEIVAAQERRLRRFIRRQVLDRQEVDDILQEVFYELTNTYRLMKPIEQVGAWLFRVAKNRITDRFRRRQHEASADGGSAGDLEDGWSMDWEHLLPAPDGPEAEFAREVLLEEIEQAIGELPAVQREVFIAHELEGLSFKELAARSGVGVNTLLSRKHAAVTALRTRLLAIYEEFNEFEGGRP